MLILYILVCFAGSDFGFMGWMG